MSRYLLIGCVTFFYIPQEPIEVLFGEEMYVSQFSGCKQRKVARSDKFYYVPILHTLQKLLLLEEFQSEVLNSHYATDENELRDFCDGSLFQNHPLFSVDVHALQIVAYFDELEIVNPIGSFVKKHKLGCLFFFSGKYSATISFNVQSDLFSCCC